MAKETIVIRADASLEIGTGHVMRCLTLASALRARGYVCHFICREHPGNLIDFVREQGHQVYALPLVRSAQTEVGTAHARWLGSTQARDATDCSPILERLQPKWLVIDHYALDGRWEQQLRVHCGKILVIDDLADRPHQCDILLDQTLGRDPTDYKQRVPESTKLLCGAKYSLIRPEFPEIRNYSLERRKPFLLRHLLISMGGVDKDNATGRILEALVATELFNELTITVVMGGSSPWIADVSAQSARMPIPTNVRCGVNNMAQLMADSDLAIGAAGATSWERCCLGLPTIMFVLADNQLKIAQALSDTGAAILADQEMLENQTWVDLLKSIDLCSMSEKAAEAVDGWGVMRLVKELDSQDQPCV